MARSNPLETLERIIRNLPISGKTTWRYIDTDMGRIRFAYGKAADGKFHGVWALDDSTGTPKVCRTLEFTKENTGPMVAAHLAKEGLEILVALSARSMNRAEWWDSKRTSNGR